MTIRGCTSTRRLWAFWMKYVSIFSVTLKSAMTPSFIGLMATTFPGVRPSISLASRPTATTSPLDLLIATIEGSLTTMPLPCAKTSVFAVPRSMARSEENRLNTDLMLSPFLFIATSPRGERLSAARPAIALTSSRPAPEIYCLRTPRPAQTRFGLSSKLLLRNHDGHLLHRRSAPAIRTDNRNRVLAGSKLLGEVPEIAIRRDVRHGLAVHNQSRAGFRPANDLHRVSNHLLACYLQDHILRLALGDQREFENFADFAGLFFSVRRRNVPEVVAGIETRDVHARAFGWRFLHSFREHCGSTDSQRVGNRLLHGLPLEMNGISPRILRRDRREIQRLDKIGGRKDVGFLNRSALGNREFFVRRQINSLFATSYLRAAA